MDTCKDSTNDTKSSNDTMSELRRRVGISSRKKNKPLIEKRRRARINDCLQQLKDIIVKERNIDSVRSNRLEKADILEMTVDYIRNLNRGDAKSADNRAYELGIEKCVQEMLGFLASQKDDIDSTASRNLVTHCRNLLNQRIDNVFGNSHVRMNCKDHGQLDAEVDSSTSPNLAKMDGKCDTGMQTCDNKSTGLDPLGRSNSDAAVENQNEQNVKVNSDTVQVCELSSQLKSSSGVSYTKDNFNNHDIPAIYNHFNDCEAKTMNCSPSLNAQPKLQKSFSVNRCTSSSHTPDICHQNPTITDQPLILACPGNVFIVLDKNCISFKQSNPFEAQATTTQNPQQVDTIGTPVCPALITNNINAFIPMTLPSKVETSTNQCSFVPSPVRPNLQGNHCFSQKLDQGVSGVAVSEPKEIQQPLCINSLSHEQTDNPNINATLVNPLITHIDQNESLRAGDEPLFKTTTNFFSPSQACNSFTIPQVSPVYTSITLPSLSPLSFPQAHAPVSFRHNADNSLLHNNNTSRVGLNSLQQPGNQDQSMQQHCDIGFQTTPKLPLDDKAMTLPQTQIESNSSSAPDKTTSPFLQNRLMQYIQPASIAQQTNALNAVQYGNSLPVNISGANDQVNISTHPTLQTHISHSKFPSHFINPSLQSPLQHPNEPNQISQIKLTIGQTQNRPISGQVVNSNTQSGNVYNPEGEQTKTEQNANGRVCSYQQDTPSGIPCHLSQDAAVNNTPHRICTADTSLNGGMALDLSLRNCEAIPRWPKIGMATTADINNNNNNDNIMEADNIESRTRADTLSAKRPVYIDTNRISDLPNESKKHGSYSSVCETSCQINSVESNLYISKGDTLVPRQEDSSVDCVWRPWQWAM